MSARLVSLKLDNFRGFARAQTLDLDADIILVRGDNGSGKSSITDGILWVLTGQVPHLNERMRGIRSTHDPIKNRYGDGDALVALTVRTDVGTWRFERAGSARSNRLSASLNGELMDGEQGLARAFGEETPEALRQAVATWGILRQDAVRSVLDAGGAALHARMSSVIGLADVTRFREACRATSLELAQLRRQSESVHSKAISGVVAAQRAQDTFLATLSSSRAPSLQERLVRLAQSVGSGVDVDVAGIDDLVGIVSLGQEVSTLVEVATAAADAHERSVQLAAMVRESSNRLETELASAQEQAEELARFTSDTQRLAEAALQLLGEHCPVCDQPIDADSVRTKLKRDVERNAIRMVAAAEARNSVAAISQRLVETRSAEVRRDEAEANLHRSSSSLSVALEESPRIAVREEMRQAESLRALAHRLDEIRTQLRRLHAEASAVNEVEGERYQARITASAGEEARAKAELERTTSREDNASRLAVAAQKVEERVVSDWLRELEPSFAEVFDRLSPHPTFSELRARQDIYYNKNQIVPEVVDPVRGVTANPLLVYSEGQLNTVALSYFLGLALNAPSTPLGFMVLDDPLQAMDVLAVLGFADLCRRLRHDRQLLITTHDRRYADLLARKLAPREPQQISITHEIEGWSEDGPQISSRRQPYVEFPVVLQDTAS